MEFDEIETLIRYDEVIYQINEFITLNNLIPQIARNLVNELYHKYHLTSGQPQIENILLNETDVIEYLSTVDISKVPRISKKY